MNMKKLVSLVLALVMVMAMMVPAMAATVIAPEGHTYKAYQVFSGTQAESQTALGDVEWGTGVNGTNLLAAIKADSRFVVNEENIFADCTTAAQVAVVLAKYEDNSEIAKAFANVAAANLTTTATEITTATELPAGYYLMVDVTELTGNEHDALNSALLQVTNKGEITIAKKYSVPSVDKDITKAGETTFTNGIEGADAEIGNSIEFTLTGTLPSNYADYETYKYVFHDTLSAGLTYNGDAKVYLNTVSAENEITSNFTIDPAVAQTTGGGTLTVTCDNLKGITNKTITADSKIIVVYTATLNSSANIGDDGNLNKVYLEYTNDPNYDGEGTPTTGKTPEDEVLVFTYELDVTKVDGAQTETKLQGAEFVLLNATKNKVATVVNGKLTGWADVPAAVDGKITWPANTTLTSDANGKFIIQGLDAATYYLRETKAPAGYNLLTADIKVVITATITPAEGTEADSALTELKIAVNDGTATNGAVDTGIVDAQVINHQGATLPETGGMGTTMMYIGGGLLVAFAVIMLVTKRRMGTAE